MHLSVGFSNLLDPSRSTAMSWSSGRSLARFLVNFMVSWSTLVPLGIGQRYVRMYSVTLAILMGFDSQDYRYSFSELVHDDNHFPSEVLGRDMSNQ